MSISGRPAPEAVRRWLGVVLASDTFARSERLRSFLAYVVESELAGKAGLLKGYSIGIDVFGRPTGFDAGNDPIVRVQAGKLRKLLDQYYDDEGSADDMRIRIPLGSYVPYYVSTEEANAAACEGDICEPTSGTFANVPPANSRKRQRCRAGWLPAPVSSPLALFSLLPLFFLAPSVYPDAASIGIANAQLVIAVESKLATRHQSLPYLRIQQCWPAGAECRSLAEAISLSAGFHRTVRLIAPRDRMGSSPLSYSVRIENHSDGQAIYARLVHDQSGETIYARRFVRQQLRDETGVSYEAVSFAAQALTVHGPLYRHALRIGNASSFMQCLSHADGTPPGAPSQPAVVTTCTSRSPGSTAALEDQILTTVAGGVLPRNSSSGSHTDGHLSDRIHP